MPKSKYPNNLDTSVEIPVVRDNITEIGSDVLNSLRSALFQIEKTLGINPQGAAGNTVSARMSRSLDESGNILKSALDRASVLSGPISDSDVSKAAAIKESKLKLNFPTHLLQDEISILNSQIDAIILQVEELNAVLSAHINPSAINRHNATAITVAATAAGSDDSATMSLSENDLQTMLEELYSGHINFSGKGVGEENNSHSASQLYYNNEDTVDVIPDIDVQGAIDTLATLGISGFRDALLNLNSNGIIRSGSTTDIYEDRDLGSAIVFEHDITYTSSSESTTEIIFSSPFPEISEEIKDSYYLTIASASSEEDNGYYQIKDVNVNSSNELLSLNIFGTIKNNSSVGVTGTITKTTYSGYNPNSLNCAVRHRSDKTNTPDVFVCNPNSATIVSKGIEPSKITPEVRAFKITIDDYSPVEIPVYDSSVYDQTIDTIVNKINEYSCDNNLNILAYKLRRPQCFELAISHVLPALGSGDDIKNRTLKIESAGSYDALSVLGMDHHTNLAGEPKVFEGTYGNSYHINGLILTDLPISNLSSNDVELIVGSNKLVMASESPESVGIREGTLLVVSGASSTDDGTYRVRAISGNSIFLDNASLSWTSGLTDSSIIHIVNSAAPCGELTFTEKVDVDGSILFDTFITENRNVFFKKRLEIDGALSLSGFSAAIVDVSSGFLLKDKFARITITPSLRATLNDPSGTDGDPVYIGVSGEYKIFASDRMSYVVLKVNASSAPASSISVDIYGFNDVSSQNLHLSRGLFATSLGRVLGTSSEPGIPSVIDKRSTGTVDKTIISENILEKYIEGPRNELRASGIVRGCEVVNRVSHTETVGGVIVSFQTVDVNAGVHYCNGIRREFPGKVGFRVNTTKPFFIGFDADGCLIWAESRYSLISGSADLYWNKAAVLDSFFKNYEVAYLAFVDPNYDLSYDNELARSTYEITDLRLKIDNIDNKLLGDIIVSNDERCGHFTDIKSAIRYASFYEEMYPDSKAPTIFIEAGEYLIDESIIVDFDVTVRGSGAGTILRRSTSSTFADGADRSIQVPLSTAAFVIGRNIEFSSRRIKRGVRFSDFTWISNPDMVAPNVSTVFCVSQQIGVGEFGPDGLWKTMSKYPEFYFENIKFIGPSAQAWGNSADASDRCGEWAIILAQEDGSGWWKAVHQMGNLHITGCSFIKMGTGVGPCMAVCYTTTHHLRNVIVTGNIARKISPATMPGKASADAHPESPGSIGEPYRIFHYPAYVTGVGTVSNIVESANSLLDD